MAAQKKTTKGRSSATRSGKTAAKPGAKSGGERPEAPTRGAGGVRELRADELESTTPAASDLAQAVNAIPLGDPDTVRDVQQRLDRSAHADTSTSAWPPILEEPRRRADVRFADPATSHRPLVGPALVAAKRTFRAVFQPFINEMLRRQVEFNESLLSSLAVMYEQLRVQAQTQALWRKEIEERLEALEKSRGER